MSPSRPKLYFVKVDVQACFDTIDQGKLLGIIQNLISEVEIIALCQGTDYMDSV